MNKEFLRKTPGGDSSSRDIFQTVQKILTQGKIDQSEAKAETGLIITEISGFRIEEILAGKEISPETVEKIKDVAKKRVETGAPIQHILGFAYFMNDKFFVDKNALIPRPETELLVRCAVETIRNIASKQNFQGNISVLDIGTGTGCIPVEISKALPDLPMELMGVDISTDALFVAIKNMEALGEQRRVIFRKSDIFSGLRPIDKFDVVVSNPPYIPLSAREELQDEVKNFDPELALFTKDEFGTEFYEKILKDAKKYLKPKGSVLFELGINQALIVQKLGQKYGFELKSVTKDLAGIERVIRFSA